MPKKTSTSSHMLAAAGIALAVSVAGFAARAADTMPTLDMFDELSLEKRALQIVNMPQVQQQKHAVEEMYRKNWLAKTADGRAGLAHAADNFALMAVQVALLDDPARPKIMWACNLGHDWHGVHWPGANWGIDNPDNLYRYLFVDGASRYEITGQRRGAGPMQETFLVYSSVPGTTEHDLEGAKVVGSISLDDVKVAADGSFTITVGPEPGGPGTNHLQIAPDAKVIFIRDTLGDWSKQYPAQLRVQRVAGPAAAAPRSDDAVATQAAAYLKAETSYWLQYFQEMNYKNPPNTVPQPIARTGKWGMLSSNWFKLKNDEALVVTLDPVGATYLEFQIANPWSITPDYADHTSGLNNAQSKPNADGTYTYVIAPHDPGVWNWIDTQGITLGLFTLRWQHLADGTPTHPQGVRDVKVVKMGDLKKALPADTVWVSANERAAQLSDRAAGYALRLAN
jgi:hypothetical protein